MTGSEVLSALGVSLADVGRRAGCSAAHVSNVLAARRRLRPNVTEAIRALAGDLALRRVLHALERQGRAA